MNIDEARIAYFSMEIGINENMPTYSGGLGVLAGDTLRSCADLKVPVVGVTLLYRKGYFKQTLDENGNQMEVDDVWEPKQYLKKLSKTASVRIEGRPVKIACWQYVHEGVSGESVPVLFLDTDLPANSEYDRSITDHLYGNDERYRLAQEMVLGIGGIRMLDELGASIERYHMNEGHSALLALELYKKVKGRSRSDDFIKKVRRKCVFTTHTPVPAGHDQFSKGLVESMFGDYINPELESEVFYSNKLNMTYLALRFSKFINGVAKKHGEVSRGMFPGYHIESITNGVHSGYWTSDSFAAVFDKYVPGWRNDPFSLRYILSVPNPEIWKAHMQAKKVLLDYVNKEHGLGMDPNVFTMGFARRATAYKRGEMLFSDIERLKRIAEGTDGIQIIFAGKAHPRDTEGKQIIAKLVQDCKALSGKVKACYLEDYDMRLAKIMVAGVDVWLNTPLKPFEASGTSGMKAAHNGVLHFSVLDGWWLEGHIEHETGWCIGDRSKENDTARDIEDMYDKIEKHILPLFYFRRDDWILRMKHAIAINGSFFNSHRMVQQYVLNAYFE